MQCRMQYRCRLRLLRRRLYTTAELSKPRQPRAGYSPMWRSWQRQRLVSRQQYTSQSPLLPYCTSQSPLLPYCTNQRPQRWQHPSPLLQYCRGQKALKRWSQRPRKCTSPKSLKRRPSRPVRQYTKETYCSQAGMSQITSHQMILRCKRVAPVEYRFRCTKQRSREIGLDQMTAQHLRSLHSISSL